MQSKIGRQIKSSDRRRRTKKKSGPDIPARPVRLLRWSVDYGVVFVPMYGATPGTQTAGLEPGGKPGTPPAGPMRPDVLVFVEAMAGVQPLPSHAASKSTLYRPEAVIETTTQFWLGRGVGKFGCSARLTWTPAGAGVPPTQSTRPLLRFRYIQPPTSPAGEARAGKVPELVAGAEVSGSVMLAGTDGEMMTPGENVCGFSCSSKRTISVIGMKLLPAVAPVGAAAFALEPRNTVQAPVGTPCEPSRQIL